ncbi:MAG: CPBP family intramembrane metalloprotease [bacterium]|nr:CPBP family intramembrane metalloprotease [bacterium]
MLLLKTELKELGYFIKRNYKEILVVSLAALFFILHKYHRLNPQWFSQFIYYGILPLTALVLLRGNPLKNGLGLGNVRIWGVHVLIACFVAFVIILIASQFSSMSGYYGVKKSFSFFNYAWPKALELMAWEFIFRGFLLFGLKDKFGEGAILIQMIPFTIFHFGKPEVETISCIITGIYFGYVAYRGKSFWPAYIIHLFLNLWNKAVQVYF